MTICDASYYHVLIAGSVNVYWTNCHMHIIFDLLTNAGCLQNWLMRSAQDAPECRLLLSLGHYEGIPESEILDCF